MTWLRFFLLLAVLGLLGFVLYYCGSERLLALGAHELAAGAVAILIAIAALQWLAYIFRLGRYGLATKETPVLFTFMGRLVSNFRHLLALGVLVVFGFITFLMLLPGLRASDVGMMEAGLKSSAAYLGPWVAATLVYYFQGTNDGGKAPQEQEQGSGPLEQVPPANTNLIIKPPLTPEEAAEREAAEKEAKEKANVTAAADACTTNEASPSTTNTVPSEGQAT